MRGNFFKVPVIAHNLFQFDLFLLAKSLRTSVWKTKDVCIGGRNPTDINFATIGNQVQFVDSIKYCQRSLGALASSLTISEKSAIYDECKNNLFQDEKVSKAFENLNQIDQDWVLSYLSSGKGATPYQLISDFDSLNISPEK